jgi:hypothetical protein
MYPLQSIEQTGRTMKQLGRNRSETVAKRAAIGWRAMQANDILILLFEDKIVI